MPIPQKIIAARAREIFRATVLNSSALIPQRGDMLSGVNDLICSDKAWKPSVCASTYCLSNNSSSIITFNNAFKSATSLPGVN